jgi:protein ImuB
VRERSRPGATISLFSLLEPPRPTLVPVSREPAVIRPARLARPVRLRGEQEPASPDTDEHIIRQATSPGRTLGEEAGALPLRRRRVVALYFPDLACELAALVRESAVGVAGALAIDRPLAVVLSSDGYEVNPGSVIHGATAQTRRLGVAPGQTVEEALGFVPSLDVRPITPGAVEDALRCFAEIALAMSPLVGLKMPDLLLLDTTGCAHFFGGEEAMLSELCDRMRALGHRVRACLASSPVVASAMARLGPSPCVVIPRGRDVEALGPLPLRALRLDEPTLRGLSRRGLLTVRDLLGQTREAVTAADPTRPADDEIVSIDLPSLLGNELAAMEPYQPLRTIREQLRWESPVSGPEPLRFALRGLMARVAARLAGRGESAVDLTIELENALPDRTETPSEGLMEEDIPARLPVHLSSPLHRATDLMNAVRPRIDALVAWGPLRAVSVEVTRLVPQVAVQLDFSHDGLPRGDLTSLVADLSAELGEDRVGLLGQWPDRSSLSDPGPAPQSTLWPERPPAPPTRLLDVPVLITGRLVRGGKVSIDGQAFVVERITEAEPILLADGTAGPPGERSCCLVWLSGGGSGAQALVLRDRRRHRVYLHGWYT